MSGLFMLLFCARALCAEWWSSWSPPQSSTPLNITVCTQVTYGTGYMFEWIEYHALLGVTKYVIYDAGSKGDLTRLGHLFSQRYGPDFVTIIKAKNDQYNNFRQCVTMYRHQTDWFAIMDNDEFFVFPTTSPILSNCSSCSCGSKQEPRTLDLFLRHVPSKVGRLYVHAARFGSNNWAAPSPYVVSEAQDGGAFLSPDVMQLVTEIHSFRGPHNVLDGPASWGRQRFSREFRGLCNETKELTDVTYRVCGHGLGKSLFRAGHAWTIPDDPAPNDQGRFIHRFPTFPDREPFSDFVPMWVLRMHHYSLRNFAEASAALVWKHLAESKARRVQADLFFNEVSDLNATCYAHQLRRRMTLLQREAFDDEDDTN